MKIVCWILARILHDRNLEFSLGEEGSKSVLTMGESGDILNAQLCDAVWKNDIEGAKHLLEKGASVDARDKSPPVSVD